MGYGIIFIGKQKRRKSCRISEYFNKGGCEIRPLKSGSDYRAMLMRTAFYSKKPLKNLKYCIQRIKRGYCDADLWEIDSWFLGVIVPMLRQFAETRTGGCPVGLTNHFVPDINENMDSDKIYKIGEQKWNEAIKKLADDFETLERMHYDIETKDKERTALKDKCFETFSEWFFDLWD